VEYFRFIKASLRYRNGVEELREGVGAERQRRLQTKSDLPKNKFIF
jgi:hypothetical protein